MRNDTTNNQCEGAALALPAAHQRSVKPSITLNLTADEAHEIAGLIGYTLREELRKLESLAASGIEPGPLTKKYPETLNALLEKVRSATTKGYIRAQRKESLRAERAEQKT